MYERMTLTDQQKFELYCYSLQGLLANPATSLSNRPSELVRKAAQIASAAIDRAESPHFKK